MYQIKQSLEKKNLEAKLLELIVKSNGLEQLQGDDLTTIHVLCHNVFDT